MTLPSYAGYVIVPLHLVAGFLFALIPGSVYQSGYYAAYGAIAVVLAATVFTYGWLTGAQPAGFGVVWLQVLLAAAVAAVPFFAVEFSAAWHALLYVPIMGASLLACLITGHVVLLIVRP